MKEIKTAKYNSKEFPLERKLIDVTKFDSFNQTKRDCLLTSLAQFKNLSYELLKDIRWSINSADINHHLLKIARASGELNIYYRKIEISNYFTIKPIVFQGEYLINLPRKSKIEIVENVENNYIKFLYRYKIKNTTDLVGYKIKLVKIGVMFVAPEKEKYKYIGSIKTMIGQMLVYVYQSKKEFKDLDNG